MLNYLPRILDAGISHAILAYGALLASFVFALLLAVAALYFPRLSYWIISFVNLVQAIPSLAVVAAVVPLIGIGRVPAVLAIVLRTLLPIVKNTYVGMSCIDASIIDSARGIGMSRWQTLVKIRIPNAYPSMFAGLKFAAIIASSITILTGMLIGSGGFGEIINSGLPSFNVPLILAGTIPAMFLAILVDALISAIEKRITPEALR